MIIHPTVAQTCAHWGQDPALIQAMVRAEGGPEAFVRAVQCSKAISNFPQAVDVACRSATHRMWEYVKANVSEPYVLYLGSKWAPIGAANDPHGLNANWVHNVYDAWILHP